MDRDLGDSSGIASRWRVRMTRAIQMAVFPAPISSHRMPPRGISYEGASSRTSRVDGFRWYMRVSELGSIGRMGMKVGSGIVHDEVSCWSILATVACWNECRG